MVQLSIYLSSIFVSIYQMGGRREACDRNGGKTSRELESIMETRFKYQGGKILEKEILNPVKWFAISNEMTKILLKENTADSFFS